MTKLLWMQGVYLGNNGRIWEKLIVASATVAHKPHAELDSIYQGQEPKGESVLGFQASILQKNICINYRKVASSSTPQLVAGLG